jgi:hypothetical protein
MEIERNVGFFKKPTFRSIPILPLTFMFISIFLDFYIQRQGSKIGIENKY